jgi:hypothetical protein
VPNLRLIEEGEATGALKAEYDAAIHDALQVVSYFNYINRIADAVGVDAEPEWAPY